MRRREFIAVLAAVIPGARLLRPAHAQTSGIRRIGVIYQGGPYEASIEGLREGSGLPGLKKAGMSPSFFAITEAMPRRRKRRRAPWSATTRST